MVLTRSVKTWFSFLEQAAPPMRSCTIMQAVKWILSTLNIYGTVLTLAVEIFLTMKLIKFSVLMLIASSVVIIACQKESSSESATLKIRMTVRVNFRDDSAGWVSLPTNAGIYNLLGLQNGVDTLIAQGTVPMGTLKEIRFVLGDSNSIVVNGQSHPLTIPSGSSSGLKIKVGKKIATSLDSLLIDFDAAMSVKEQNGNYKLMPVLKLK